MLLANLSAHQRKLYQLLILGAGAGLFIGLLAGVINFHAAIADKGDHWQASALPAKPDTLEEFTVITTNSRWFTTQPSAAQNKTVSLEGQPEGFKLLGIVERNKQRYALVMDKTTTTGPKKVTQLAVGDTLVGDWKVTGITQDAVTVAAAKDGAAPETRQLSLYQSKK